MSDHAALIANLVAATDMNREFDAAIAVAIFVTSMTDDDLIYAVARRRDGSDATHPGHYFIKSRSGATCRAAPSYTASVDDALALVPEGWEWQVSNRAPKPRAGRAYIHNRELINIGGGMTPNPKYRGYESTAGTPAIALCIAALRAREVQ